MNGICLSSVFPHFQSTNLSVSGSTSSEVPQRQLNSLPTNAPDVFGIVVMTTGGNDMQMPFIAPNSGALISTGTIRIIGIFSISKTRMSAVTMSSAGCI